MLKNSLARSFSGLEKKLSLRLVTALTLAVPFAAGIVWIYSARVYPTISQTPSLKYNVFIRSDPHS